MNFFSLVIAFVICNEIAAKTDKATEFIEMLREKVHRLEDAEEISRDYEPYTESKIHDNEEYDFIIVGAGSSGSAIVRRLTEIPEWKILLVEAGGEPDIISDIPVWSPLAHQTDINWKFFTEKEDNFALGMENQRMYWPRGKALGGTSLLNYMIFSRGAHEDYDRWANLGNPGWSYEDVLPYFKKLENCTIDKQDEGYRGHDGPISVEDTYSSKAGEVFIEAAQNAGYEYVDYNGEDEKGVSHCQATTKKGLRCSGERCYIKPIKNRPNLTIRLHGHVTRVIIENSKASGVEFVKNGKTYKATAKREVILSAGVINSAHILLLSGVGPTEQLLKFGIEPLEDLPVGQKIYDHPVFWGLGFTLNESIIYDQNAALKDDAFKQLYNGGTGILHNLGMAENLIFTKTPLAPNNVADIELIFISTFISQDLDLGMGGLINLSRDLHEKMYRQYENDTVVSCTVTLMHPDSYGHLELRTADPLVHPKIYGGYFTDPAGNDIKTMIAGIREAIRVMLTPPFDKYGVKFIDKPMIGCEQQLYDSDEYWECALRHLTGTLFHHTSTCKMGPADDPEAVVDNRLRVYGVNNLRVADTSIIPIQITGHTNVPAYLVGEKAAEMIKEEYLHESKCVN